MFRAPRARRRPSPSSPHARGDVPTLRGRAGRRALFSPRPWGCSGPQAHARLDQRLLPTPVGMFRSQSSAARRSRPSPHARGDVPRFRPAAGVRHHFSPRPWGCSGVHRLCVPADALLPTPVGMFRASRRWWTTDGTSPHARGDVPCGREFRIGSSGFSPRPWGCSGRLRRLGRRGVLLPTPVGMFRPCPGALRTRAPSPHARGDVPMTTASSPSASTFSPRPWGCSSLDEKLDSKRGLLPTPVGMFRPSRITTSVLRPSPHARGDVPVRCRSSEKPRSFSPRPWGCSVMPGHRDRPMPLLPTPVGMFRRRRPVHLLRHASPHARGDVPRTRGRARPCSSFSPRPWGCSAGEALRADLGFLLPTPVGMFRRSTPSPRTARTSPHARGDVPWGPARYFGGNHFSPRPWGCSVHRSI